MKTKVERRKPEGIKDYIALAVTTFGVGYLPLAPGTWGSMVGVAIYLLTGKLFSFLTDHVTIQDPLFDLYNALIPAVLGSALVFLILIGIWASSRAIEMLGNTDPSEAVVDEVIGQLITFLFIPFTFALVSLEQSWTILLSGFLLFRLFDIWKPYPIDYLQVLPGGIGLCADDILAGVYAGVCLSVIYAVSLSI